MVRGGMRVGILLNLTPADIQERSLTIQNPKSGRAGETVYVPRKILQHADLQLKDISEK
jgi:integrase